MEARQRFLKWRKSKVRAFGPGHRSPRGWYICWTPRWGACINWFHGARLRIAKHHGVQRVVWRGERWVVDKQLLGRSTVIRERYAADVKGSDIIPE